VYSTSPILGVIGSLLLLMLIERTATLDEDKDVQDLKRGKTLKALVRLLLESDNKEGRLIGGRDGMKNNEGKEGRRTGDLRKELPLYGQISNRLP